MSGADDRVRRLLDAFHATAERRSLLVATCRTCASHTLLDELYQCTYCREVHRQCELNRAIERIIGSRAADSLAPA